MKLMQTTVREMLAFMRENKWPVSVQHTMIGAIEMAKDENTAAEKVWDIMRSAKTPKEAVKAVQPMLQR